MADGLGGGVRWKQSREARGAAKEVLQTIWSKAGADSVGEEVHFGAGIGGKTPFTKLRDLRIDMPEEFVLFPPLILDRISAD